MVYFKIMNIGGGESGSTISLQSSF